MLNTTEQKTEPKTKFKTESKIGSFKKITPLIAMLSVFIVPIIAAGILFKNLDKIELNTTENGKFIEEPLQLNGNLNNLNLVSLDNYNPNNHALNNDNNIDPNLYSHLTSRENQAFFLLLLEPNVCDEKCTARKLTIANIKKALHAKESFLLTMGTKELAQINNLAPGINFEVGAILLFDPQIRAIMHYAPDIDATKIFKDVKKLLKNKRAA